MSTAAPEPKANQGQPVPRIDAHAKVTGQARYASDFPVSNPAFAFLVTSAIAKGRIERMELDEAKAVPGVLDILTHENTGDLKPVKFGGVGVTTSIQRLGPEIFHDGQIIAMVVADTFEAAREAAYKMKVSYAAATPSATFDSAGTTQQDATKVSKQFSELPQAGDAEAALRSAEVVLDAEYGTPTQHHNAIELFTTTCMWTDGNLTVYEPSQFVYGIKAGAAEKLGVDPDKVRVISPYVGGGFGSKGQLTPRTALVALAAKRLNRAVKLVATRDQGFTIATYRAETRHHIRIGARRDGKIVGYSHEGWEITSRPDPYLVGGVEDSARMYAFGTVKTAVNIVHADRNTPGFMRSPPVVPYIFALETAVDEMAIKLGMDPVEFRRVNDTMTDAMGKSFTSRSLMTCYDQASAAFGWSKRNPQLSSMRDGDWLIGWGCATACYPTHIGTATARVRLLPSGEVRVQTAAHDLGTGAYTVIGQMAAEQLGVPLSSVTVELGDSSLPPAPVAGGSNTTASCCSVVMKACGAIREKLFRAASTANDGPLAGKPVAEMTLAEGMIKASGGGEEKLEDVLKRLGVGAIEDYAEFVPEGLKPESVKNLYAGKPGLTGGSQGEHLMYAFGAEFVEVRVHAMTREIRVPRMVGAFAAGRIMNTRTAHSQLMGGMIWGIGAALHEATEIDPHTARYVNDNFADYLVPVNADVDKVDVILVSETDDKVNPAGVKGMGELGNVGTAAAVSNAVYHATGIRVRQLPIRLEKLLPA